MFKNQYELSVDIKKKMSAIVPTFVQYDHAVLIFRVFDNGKKFDLTNFTGAQVNHRKPDGTIETGDATIEGTGGNRWIKYTYRGTEMNKLGYVDTSLTLQSSDKKVTIQPFKVLIVEDLAEEYASPANPQVGALQQLIVKVESLKVDVEKAISDSATQTTHAKTQGGYAKTQGTHAKTQGDFAKDQGSYAKTQGDFAKAEGLATKAVKEATELVKTQTETVKNETSALRDEIVDVTVRAEDAVTSITGFVDDWKYAKNYNLETQYKKNNVVSYNGSSYAALQDNIGTPPTEKIGDLNWLLVARKGEDGKGLVVLHKQAFKATANQTVFTLDNEYDQMQNRVRVIVGGVEQFSPNQFLETTSNSIKMNTPVPKDTDVTIVYYGNAPALVNDMQLQLDNIKDMLSVFDLQETRDVTDYAQTQGDYAKTEGAKVASKIIEVDTAIANATTQASKANTAATNADTKAQLAQDATTSAISAKNQIELLLPNVEGMENKGEFSGSTQYRKNNLVEYNGSAFQALKDTIGTQPPTLPIKSNASWTLVAQKGIDGSGSVATVNGLSPNIEGDVNLGMRVHDGSMEYYDNEKWNTVTVTVYKQTFVATEGQTIFTLDREYNVGENRINVIVGGVEQFSPSNFLESSSNSITFKEGLPAGTEVAVTHLSKSIPINSDIQILIDSAETRAIDHADTGLAKKVDKVVGKQLSTEDFTTTEKDKLAGIASGANNYVHPTTHSPSIIVQDENHRFVTDIQITSWDAKSDFDGAFSSLTGIPETFTPSSHGHTVADVTDFTDSVDSLIEGKVGINTELKTTDKSTIVGAVNELFTSVSSGKQTIATAITDKGVLTEGSDTFEIMATNISKIETGIKTDDATAIGRDILQGKVAYANGVRIVGDMTPYMDTTITPTNKDVIIPEGFYGLGSKVSAVTVPAGNVLTGTTIAGTAGTMPNRGSIGTLLPTTSNLNLPAGYYGAFSIAGSSSLTAGNIRSGVNIFGVAGNYTGGRRVVEIGGVVNSIYISHGATSFTVQYRYIPFNPSDVFIVVPVIETNGGKCGGAYRKGYINTYSNFQTGFDTSYSASTQTLTVTFSIYQSPGYYFYGTTFPQNWSTLHALE